MYTVIDLEFSAELTHRGIRCRRLLPNETHLPNLKDFLRETTQVSSVMQNWEDYDRSRISADLAERGQGSDSTDEDLFGGRRGISVYHRAKVPHPRSG